MQISDMLWREPTGEEIKAAYMASEYKRFGGKEAYDKYWSDYRAAMASAPALPDLKTILATLWAGHLGEDWEAMTEAEKLARTAKMGATISRG